jgi:hypothetical protein
MVRSSAGSFNEYTQQMRDILLKKLKKISDTTSERCMRLEAFFNFSLMNVTCPYASVLYLQASHRS